MPCSAPPAWGTSACTSPTPIRNSALTRALGAPVNVKATTGEGVGFVGREEGVVGLATVTVRAV